MSDRCVLTLPLRVTDKVSEIFEGRRMTAQMAYNDTLTEYLGRLDQLKQSKDYRRLVAELAVSKKSPSKKKSSQKKILAKPLTKKQLAKAEKARKKSFIGTGTHPKVLSFATAKERHAAWAALYQKHGLDFRTTIENLTPDGLLSLAKEKAFQSFLVNKHGAEHRGMYGLNAHIVTSSIIKETIQKSFSNHRFGKGGKPQRHSFLDPIMSVTAVDHASGMSFNPKTLLFVWKTGKGNAYRTTARAIVKKGDFVAAQMLRRDIVNYCVVKKIIRGKTTWWLQLTLKGQPIKKDIGAVAGIVGLDLGTQHVAIVSPTKSLLTNITQKSLVAIAKKRVRIHQAMARSLKETNREHFDVNAKGGRGGYKKGVTLTRSKRFIRLRAHQAELSRVAHRIRTVGHGRLVNHILTFGTTIHGEKLSSVALQKCHGKTTERTAPGAFTALLKRRAALYGGGVIELPTAQLKLSRLCLCGKEEEHDNLHKPILDRIGVCSRCGLSKIQRDLFSAFLALHVTVSDEETLVDLSTANADWNRAAQDLQGTRQEYLASDCWAVPAQRG